MTGFESPYDLVNFAAGVVSLLGILYLLYGSRLVVHYARFFRFVAAGLAAFAVTGPLLLVLPHVFVHAIHALAALLIGVGFYSLVADGLDDSEFEAAFGVGTDGEFE